MIPLLWIAAALSVGIALAGLSPHAGLAWIVFAAAALVAWALVGAVTALSPGARVTIAPYVRAAR